MRIVDKMKKRWGVGPLGVVAIMASFALSGMTIVRLKTPVLDFLLPAQAPSWERVVVYILVVFPLYQLSLLIYGTLLGQFSFFWGRAKYVGRCVVGKRRTAADSE